MGVRIAGPDWNLFLNELPKLRDVCSFHAMASVAAVVLEIGRPRVPLLEVGIGWFTMALRPNTARRDVTEQTALGQGVNLGVMNSARGYREG